MFTVLILDSADWWQIAKATMWSCVVVVGQPRQNGTTENFNGKFREEYPSMEWFRNQMEAKAVIDQWRRHYNEVRPHSSLGNQTPDAFRQQLVSTTQPEAVLQE